MKTDFQFHATDDVRALGIRGVFIRMRGLVNKDRDEAFEKFKADLAQRLRPAYTPEGIKADRILQGFRALHTKIGRSNRTFPSASEALAGLLGRRGVIPSINLLVDIYNCVSLETRLALGAHDVDTIDGHVTLRLTNGSERFVPLGATEPEPVFAGEYAYTDDAPEIICRMEVKQVEKTKVGLRTTDCFYVLQGHTGTSAADLRCAADRLTSLTRQFCGGDVTDVWHVFDS
jgi:DNA/RNA-binding domain of Phe-tRNA-synthetase-like protein